MEKITAYKTTDQKIFEDSKDAEKHQAEVDIREELDKERLIGNYAGSYVEADDLIQWIRDHEQLVKKLLS